MRNVIVGALVVMVIGAGLAYAFLLEQREEAEQQQKQAETEQALERAEKIVAQANAERADLAAARAAKREAASLRKADGDRSGSPPTRSPVACPEPVCPRCEPVVGCDAVECPESRPAIVCSSHETQIRQLKEKLQGVEEELVHEREKTRKRHGYPGLTASDRRLAAAKDDHLMLELPWWGEELTMKDEWALKAGIGPEDRQRLDGMYGEYRQTLFQELQKILADLMGDPDAGTDSTVSSLLHDIMELSPSDACRGRMAMMVHAMVQGNPLAVPGPEAPPCELAAYLVFTMVDGMEQEVEGSMGSGAKEALWSGSSSFSFSVKTKKDE